MQESRRLAQSSEISWELPTASSRRASSISVLVDLYDRPDGVTVNGISAGISAGIAKFGAFLGIYPSSIIKSHFGVSGALEFSFGKALIGILLTLLFPEPAGKSLDEPSGEGAIASAEEIVRSAEVTRL